MEKLIYYVGGIIDGSISTLAALGVTEEELEAIGERYHEREETVIE